MTLDEMRENIEAARGVVADKIGEEAANLSIERPAWMGMMSQGVIVRLSIGRWRAHQTLDAKELANQLGVNADDAELGHWKDFLSMGAKRLLPLEWIRKCDALDAAARSSLEVYSYKTFWGRFVPATTYAIWKEQNERHAANYMALRDQIVAEYATIEAEVFASYRQQAGIVYERLVKLGAEPELSRDDFIDQFVETVRGAMKTAEQIAASFSYSVSLSYVPLLSAAVSEDASMKQSADMTEWAMARLDTDAVKARRAMLAEMNRDLVEQARQQKEEQVDVFIKDLVGQLRGQVYETALGYLESIKKNNGKLITRAANGLRAFVDMATQLNFFGDEELTLQLDRLRAAWQVTSGSTMASTDADIERELQELALLSRHVLLQLGETPRTGRDVGVADVVSASTIRRRRVALGAPTTGPVAALRATRTI